jgi:hypothetical protein
MDARRVPKRVLDAQLPFERTRLYPREPSVEVNEKPAIGVPQRGPAFDLAPQKDQPPPERRILGLKSALVKNFGCRPFTDTCRRAKTGPAFESLQGGKPRVGRAAIRRREL